MASLLQGALTLAQVVGDPVGDVWRDLDLLDHGAEQASELLLADVAVAAGAAEAGTAVVGVLALLPFSGHRAAAASAGEQPHESVLLLGVPRTRFPIQDVLDLLE
ncbi:MAG: hypothetical protein ABL993_09090 [Vicinamibacterales bacterium]